MHGGSTVDMFCSLYGHYELGAYLRRMTEGAPDALHASFEGNMAQLEALLRTEPDLVHCRDVSNGCTCLHFACKAPLSQAAQVVDLLLWHGADASAREPATGRTPLHYLALSGGAACTRCVKLLVDSHADPLAVDFEAVSPVQCARTWGGGEEVARVLEELAAPRRAWH